MSQTLSKDLRIDSVIGELPLHDYTVFLSVSCKEVYDFLNTNPQIPGFIVRDFEGIKSLVSRRQLLERLSRPYALDVFLKRSISELPELWSSDNQLLVLPPSFRIADGLQAALSRGEKTAYEPIVVAEDNQAPQILDVRDLLAAHARVFELTTQLLDRQQTETQRYLRRLEDQQAQIESYTRVLERQRTELESRSRLSEALQARLFNIAQLFANQGDQAFIATFGGVEQIRDQVQSIVRISTDLKGDSQQILAISETIRDIADRINLLAFNTSVEAERAGSGSQALKVLSQEVRRLAGETTKAARQIQGLAQQIREGTDREVDAANGGAKVANQLADYARTANRSLMDLRSMLSEISSQETMVELQDPVESSSWN